MHAPRADGMGLQGCGNRSRRVFYEYHLPRVVDLAALAGIAVRLMMPASSREP
jgi:hypothetical protein